MVAITPRRLTDRLTRISTLATQPTRALNWSDNERLGDINVWGVLPSIPYISGTLVRYRARTPARPSRIVRV